MVEREAAMLTRHGHQVELLMADNEAITTPAARVRAALGSFYSRASYKRTKRALAIFRPDLLHVHNMQPNLSPSVFFAANRAGVPAVQTLHNYRLLCANGLLYRDGGCCTSCVDRRSFLPGIQHACYRASMVGSAVIGVGMAAHGALGTWTHRIDRFIALTAFAAEKFSKMVVPPERIRIKPNFVTDNGIGDGSGGFALFVGRLSEEKGLRTLLAADVLGTLPLPVWIAGDGPLMAEVSHACARAGSRLVVLGGKSPAEVGDLMKRAVALVLPSLWYEGAPLVMLEALSAGLPIIASRIGGLPEIAQEGVSAIFCTPGDAGAFHAALEHFSLCPERAAAMRRAARTLYEQRYTEGANYRILIGIYEELIAERQRHNATTSSLSSIREVDRAYQVTL